MKDVSSIISPLVVLTIGLTMFVFALQSCGNVHGSRASLSSTDADALVEDIREFVDGKPGKFGVAVIVDGKDTVVFNNSGDYPMMSMFKLHEALAVCHRLDVESSGLDKMIEINRNNLDPHTWSPMLEDHAEDVFSLSIGELIDYILVHSDNNASNLLFDEIISVPEADAYVRSIIPDGEFSMRYKESEMKADIYKGYENRTSPLAYASLVNRVFTDSLVCDEKQAFIRQSMRNCNTGMGRIAAGLPEGEGIVFSHRTGSGYTNDRGEVIAINDGGFVELPSSKKYTVVVMVKDFGGDQEAAEEIMAQISKMVFDYANETD